MEDQALKDVPHTPRQIAAQRGPIPKAAIFLAVGLVLVFLLFFGPVWIDVIRGR